ncbi:MAG: CapA family protein [Gemmatimonadota bacterium]|nr:MAG: CapA family protein [Gemmatimonadota bacterium]
MRIRDIILASAVTVLASGLSFPPETQAQSDPSPQDMVFALTGDAIITQRLSPFDEPEFLALIDVIRAADMAFTNLEVLFHDYNEGYPSAHSGGTWMAAEPLLAHELVWAGFDIVSTANNHTMDYGVGGLQSTLHALNDAGLVHAGAGENLARARAPAYLETAGGRVALISFASTFADEARAGPQRADIRGRPGLNPLRYATTYVVSEASIENLKQVRTDLGYGANPVGTTLRFLGNTFEAGTPTGRRTEVNQYDLDQIVAAVGEARRQADWVVVTSHSHESGASREIPAKFIESVAHAVIDAGADLFVGHGPHVLRGIEIYGGKPIFYSLANFIFQNETVRYLPGDFYVQHGLAGGSNTADAFDRRNESSRGGFPAQAIYWESVVAVPVFSQDALKEITLYPITLGHGKPRPQRGRPLLADDDTGRRIITKLAEISLPYGVEVEYVPARNIGVIRP